MMVLGFLIDWGWKRRACRVPVVAAWVARGGLMFVYFTFKCFQNFFRAGIKSIYRKFNVFFISPF